MTVISYPIPLYANIPIRADYYEPSRFVISDITRGRTTTVTTSEDHNYIIGQQIRLLIPLLYGSSQLNRIDAYVLSIPSSTQVVLDVDSAKANPFIVSPVTATITGATQSNPAVLTASNSYRVGNFIRITGVSGMTQLNGNQYQIISATSTTITININSAGFSPYTGGGTSTLVTTDLTQPQIMAIGDVNSGIINDSGSAPVSTYIPGSFIDISPN